jgi:cytochrome c biogenesis protein CcmG, thiol:disulfide interchange protein DsbE
METTSLPPDDRPPEAQPRRVNRGLLWAAALAVVVLAVATAVAFMGGGGDSANKNVERISPNGTQPTDDLTAGNDPSGEQLPALTYKTFDGQEVALSTGGRPLVLNFWAAWCTPCVQEMPAFEQVYQANSDRIGFLGLQVTEVASAGLEQIAKTGVTYPTARDPKGDVNEALGGSGLPRTVLIAADGTVVAVHNGALSAADLQALIDEKLA